MVRKTKFFVATFILILLTNIASGCVPAAAPTLPVEQSQTNLSGIKTYLLGKSVELTTSATSMKEASDKYYELAKASGFNYAALWQSNPLEVGTVLNDAKSAWILASPQYEQMEGIVAGTP